MPYPLGAIACAALIMSFVAICGVLALFVLGLARAAGRERPKPQPAKDRRIGGVR